ncbi:MAG: hypothetical protein VKL39_16645 [Leptolyngbyaceae bacterium]|nr:hypothetical protein [Leptolyngbyaceae bacterium]
MKRIEIKMPAIAFSFLLMGVFADLLPHPALGPGLIQSCFNTLFPDPKNSTPQPQPLELGQSTHDEVAQ